MSGDIWLVLMLFWFSSQNKRNWCSWETFGKWWLSFQQLHELLLNRSRKRISKSSCPVGQYTSFAPALGLFFPLKTLSNQKRIWKQLGMCYFCMCLLHYQGSKNILNFTFPYGQVALTFCSPRVMAWLFLLSSWLDRQTSFPKSLPVGQVTNKSYLPHGKIYLPQKARWHFFVNPENL